MHVETKTARIMETTPAPKYNWAHLVRAGCARFIIGNIAEFITL